MMYGHKIFLSLCILCHLLNCTLTQALGDACTDSSQCSTSNAECDSSGTRICQCSNRYYDTNGATSGGSCTPKVYVGSTCPQPTFSVPDTATCRDNNARCMSSGSSYTCQCTNTHYDNMNSNNNNRQCISKVYVERTCPPPTVSVPGTATCRDNNARCMPSRSSYTCQCISNYYDNRNRQCNLRRGLGDSCSDTSYTLDQCSYSSATCRWESGTYKCKCNTGYHQEQQQCVANKALGETCNLAATEAECSDPAAVCLNGKCTCNTNSYDSNGLVNNGTCMPISNLQVSNVGFHSIQTDKITVTWTIPQTYKQFINKFKVTWRPTNNNNVNTESVDLASNSTSYTMTRGVDPGRAYTVTIISINNQTQQGSSRTTSVIRYQASKPSLTSGIDESNSDKDISGGTIKVAWNNATGYKSGYIVELKDGGTVKYTKTVNGVSVTFSSSGLKNGYNYDVTIQAQSEQYSGKTELGEIFISEFKTTPKLPEPPRNGVCEVSTDSSISLDWEAPTNANGDLVQYNIHVFKHSSLVFNNVTSTGTKTDKTVGNLKPGTYYTFGIYTVNEVGQSPTSLQVSSTSCRTRAMMSTKPENLQITDATSRSFLITWDKPLETYSAENYGYVLQVKDDKGACKEEVLYKCSDCEGVFQVSKLSGLCDQNKQPDFTIGQAQLASQLSYNASLNPATNYTVTVTAINDEGRGHPATMSQITKEEIPQIPYDVKVVGKNATSFDVTWSINGPRPGQTNFLIMLEADAPAESKNFTATGFALREYTAYGLQEFWNYSVSVIASTSIGSSKSTVSNKYRTLPAAPGKVSELSVEIHPDGDFTKIKISWKMPSVLERNGVIEGYRFENSAPGNVTATTHFLQNNFEDYLYKITVYVVPEEEYTFKVYAVNEQLMKGENIMVTQVAPAGVPASIEETLKIDVIALQREKAVGERQITLTLVRDFFEESTNGKIQATGIIVCINNCDFDGDVKITDVNAMENWTGASKKGSMSYRATTPEWLDKAYTQCACGRDKREVTNIEYIVGSEDCKNVSPDEFCNGPLQPGTSYKFVAFTCTNGGCLLSRQYGPFTTAKSEADSSDALTGTTQAVIVGVVLGLVIVVLLVYAGYMTYLVRRYRAKDEQEIKLDNRKDRKSQTYVNETFMTGSASNTSGNFNVDSGVENVYSRLDDNSREDKTTYESLSP